jgi:hypothetical protein
LGKIIESVNFQTKKVKAHVQTEEPSCKEEEGEGENEEEELEGQNTKTPSIFV